MNEIIISVISVVVTSVVLPLITFAGTKLIQYLNQRIKDEKTRNILTGITQIVERAVRSVFQTYVESLKKSGTFDKEAQLTALAIAKTEVMKELNDDAVEFIKTNYGDTQSFITNQIEATINLLKSS
jgi:hypothetical protein